jgi:hypothetical protein
MRLWVTMLVAGMLIGPVLGSGGAYADTAVSTETLTAVGQAYDEWDGHLGARQQCSSGATIVFEELSGRRGEYRTGSGEVVIDSTGSAHGLDSIVVHELSHHTFVACGAAADADLTAAFYAAQGLPTGRDWFDYSAGWSQAPAEHFAEALATIVVGSGEGGIPINSETVGVVSRWLAGAPATTPTAAARVPVAYSAGGASADPVNVSEHGGELPSTVGQSAEPPTESPNVAVQQEPESLPQISLERVVLPNYWRAI